MHPPYSRAPSLVPDAVHLWPVHLRVLDGADTRLRAWLDVDEEGRAARFATAELRCRFRRAHGVARAVLGWYLGISPAAITYRQGAHGKPEIEPSPESPLHFSVSRTGEWLLIGVSRAPVGVDLEAIRPVPEWEGIARRFLSAADGEYLRAFPHEERELAFLRLWVRKEALVKATGEGLGRPLDQGERLRGQGDEPVSVGDWTVFPAPAPPGCVAAVASAATPITIGLWDWRRLVTLR